MPEGPEVATIVDNLNKVLSGSIIQSITINSKSRYFGSDVWSPPNTPFRVTKVTKKGKNIFFHLSDAGNYEYLYSHLIMTGKWLWNEGNASGIVFTIRIGEEIKKLYYDDVRKWGHLVWMNKEQYESKIKTIGPDLLAGEVTPEIWTKAITNTRIKTKKVCEFLMEQNRISGIGNYLKSEILYRAGIKPDRMLCNLTKKEIGLLYKVSVDTINESYKKGGLTISDYLTPDGKKGNFNILVYGRKGKKDVNGYTILCTVFHNKRSTYWVEEIQK